MKKDIRDEVITGTFAIGLDGRKEPIDWKDYALKLEAKLSSSPSGLQWQLCPKCNGDGNLARYNSPSIIGADAALICDVCNGAKIIKPPEGQPQEQEEQEDKRILDDAKLDAAITLWITKESKVGSWTFMSIRDMVKSFYKFMSGIKHQEVDETIPDRGS